MCLGSQRRGVTVGGWIMQGLSTTVRFGFCSRDGESGQKFEQSSQSYT